MRRSRPVKPEPCRRRSAAISLLLLPKKRLQEPRQWARLQANNVAEAGAPGAVVVEVASIGVTTADQLAVLAGAAAVAAAMRLLIPIRLRRHSMQRAAACS